MSFNWRVLEEANNRDHPLLERMRFLSISAANLDEFYMVRVAGLWGQIKARVTTLSADGMTPSQTLDRVDEKAGKLIFEQQRIWKQLLGDMESEGISVPDPESMSKN